MSIEPITIDGKEWSLLYTNLAISSRYNPDGSLDASVSARFVPTRIQDGVVESSEENAIVFYRGSLSELECPAESAAMTTIKSALEQLVAAKLQ